MQYAHDVVVHPDVVAGDTACNAHDVVFGPGAIAGGMLMTLCVILI